MEWRASMAKSYKRYPMRFRERAVERMKLGENVSQLAGELKVNRISLYIWKRKLEEHRLRRVNGKERDERDLQIAAS
jgi:transposase-like protein